MKIALVLKDEIANTDLPTLLISKISEYGFDFDEDNPDVVIFVGGDGTFLRAVQTYINKVDEISFLGINEGSLGFYADFLIEELDEVLSNLASGSISTKTYRLIESHINDDVIYSVNEVRIENPFHTLIADVYIDDVYFETYRGNGLCIASSLGSSAYNKSLGGAVISPELETLQIVGIAPINNRVYHSFSSPLVLSKDKFITIRGDFSDAVVGYDHLTSCEEPKNICVRLSNKTVSLIYREDHNFVSHLHEAFLK